MKVADAFHRGTAFGWRLLEQDHLLLGGLVLALSIRLVLLPFFSDPLNFYGFRLTTSFAEQGLNPWVSIATDPAVARLNPWGYPSAYLLPTMAASALSFDNGFVFGLLVRVPLIFATLVTSIILFRTARELGLAVAPARYLALAYMFCPFTLLIDTIWGANDPLAIMFVAGGVYFAVRKEPRYDLAALMLGLGIAFKIYPVVLLPLLAAMVPTWKERVKLVLLAAVPGALSAGPVLLLSPVEFLNTLGVFVVGDGGAGATLSVPWLMRSVGEIQDPVVGRLLIGLYGAFLLFLAYRLSRKRLTFVQATTAAVLALYLVAPRLNSSYFLWALPFIFTAGAIGLWPRLVRMAAGLSWVPLAIHALIYNGAAGVTGLFYWMLVSGAPRGQPYKVFPYGTPEALVLAFVLILGLSLFFLLRPAAGATPFGRSLPALAQRLLSVSAAHASKILAGALAACLLFSAVVASFHEPFLPEDFGSYEVRDHRATISDEFHNGLFGFTYTFSGSGYFDVDLTGNGSLVTDTEGPRGNAYVTRLLPDKPVEVTLKLAVERLDGTRQFLILARIPSGWIGAQANASLPVIGGIEFLYYDDETDIVQSFGAIPLGETVEVSMSFSHERTVVRYAGLTAYGSGDTVDRILLGHPDVLPYGGGRASYDLLVLSWAVEPKGETPGLVVAILAGTVASLAIPAWQWRKARP